MTTPDLPDIGTVPTLRRLPRAFSNVQPFTYEDGLTHYQVLEQLRAFVQYTLVPALNKALEEFGDEIEDLVEGTLNDILTRLDEQTEYVDGEIADMVTYVNDAVDSIINSSITLQDSVMSGIVSNDDSLTRLALEYKTVAPSDGAFLRKVVKGEPATIVLNGHSLMYGMNVNGALPPINGGTNNRSESAPGIVFANIVSGMWPSATVIDLSRDGDDTKEYVNDGRIDGDQGDIHVFWYDSNADRELTADQLTENWSKMFLRCVNAGSQPVVVGGYISSTRSASLDREWAYATVRRIAARYGALYIDIAEIMRGHKSRRDLWTDGTHLTDAAYATIGTGLAAYFGPRMFDPTRVAEGSRIVPNDAAILGGTWTGASRASAADSSTILLSAGESAFLPVMVTGAVSPVVRFYSNGVLGYGVGVGSVLYANGAGDKAQRRVEADGYYTSYANNTIGAVAVRGQQLTDGPNVIRVHCTSGTLEIEGVDFVASRGNVVASNGREVVKLDRLAGSVLGYGTGSFDSVVEYDTPINPISATGGQKSFAMHVGLNIPAEQGAGVGILTTARADAIGIVDGIYLRRRAGVSDLELCRVNNFNSVEVIASAASVFGSGDWSGTLSLFQVGTTLFVQVDGTSVLNVEESVRAGVPFAYATSGNIPKLRISEATLIVSVGDA